MTAALEILTVAQMAKADVLAVEAGTASYTLMENAGAAVAEEIMRRWSRRPVVALCGPGNNGGDGFIAARLLSEAGWPVQVALLGTLDNPRVDAARAAAAWPHDLRAVEPAVFTDGALVIDALFGAGLTRPIEGAARATIDSINRRRLPCVAVDLPSGIHGDTGQVLGGAPKCLLTVTFFRRKPGHLLMPGREFTGEIVTADIGIPSSVLPTIEPFIQENQPAAWLDRFPWPKPSDHKYRRGHVLVSGGPVMTGAARLTAAGARRAGAGLVSLACSPATHAIYVSAPGLITAVVEDDESFVELLADPRRNVLAIGPGHGLSDSTKRRTLAGLATGKSCVIDADALTVFADRPSELLDAIHSPCVLTPHEGEFRKLFPTIPRASGKVARALAAAGLGKAVILLKGADTVAASPDGRAFINTNAPATLATGGTGDVLCGLLAGYLAQGVEPLQAAAITAWVHGAAASAFGPGLIAEDILDMVPKTLRLVRELSDSSHFSH
ncbi:MAG: NAD(P)H-hydrate dehydratase [Dongiaceae bacterium]